MGPCWEKEWQRRLRPGFVSCIMGGEPLSSLFHALECRLYGPEKECQAQPMVTDG